ncbi:hypothetical protein JXR93_08870 [bacterium]|nr:hypothetical protein [bacterium]
MKTAKMLLLAIFSLVFAMGCEVAKDTCESNADCDSGDACYAGYCSSVVPSGEMYIKLDLVNQDNVQEYLPCASTDVDKVEISFKRGTFTLPEVDENGFVGGTKDGVKFRYKTTIGCENLNSTDLSELSLGYYFGGNENEATAMGPFQQGKSYVMVARFLSANNTEVLTQEFDVNAEIIGTTQPEINNTVKVEKVVFADLTVNFEVNQGGDEYKDSSACGTLGIEKFYVLRDALPDTDNTYLDYEEISCSSAWSYIERLDSAYNGSLNIYAVDSLNEKLFKYEGTLNVTQEQFDTGAVTKTITLQQVSNKK